MSASLEITISELHDKQAIREVIDRFARALDRQDRALMLECFHPDGLDDHGLFVGRGAEFFDWTYPSHLHLFRTHQHIMTNHTCALEGDTAHCETYWAFAGMAEGGGLAQFGGRYVDRMEKRDGEWRIAARKLLVEWWAEGTMAPEVIEAYAAVGTIARDRSDCSYDRPLTIAPARVGLRGGF
ncbi:MAG: nuclear transport factor 2 family protein [Novosphingobium sp.]|nr:nuclear transport factor 2 family protein [Novosphingobium sp.]